MEKLEDYAKSEPRQLAALQRGVEFSFVKSRSLVFNFHSMAGLPRYEPPVENLHPVDFFPARELAPRRARGVAWRLTTSA
jgi:hypothetical protein